MFLTKNRYDDIALFDELHCFEKYVFSNHDTVYYIKNSVYGFANCYGKLERYWIGKDEYGRFDCTVSTFCLGKFFDSLNDSQKRELLPYLSEIIDWIK